MFYFVILIISCGLGESHPVVNGTDGKKNEFPYIVSFRNEDGHFCGGAIIAKDYILSAYHCLEGNYLKDIKVVAGTISKTKADPKYTFKVERVYRFNNKRWLRACREVYDDRHDLMILKLNGNIPISDRAKVAKLPQNSLSPGMELTFAGWGLTMKKVNPDSIQKLSTFIQTKEICKQLADAYKIEFFSPYETCTFAGKGKGICIGDSGGPFIVDGVLVGIALYSMEKCAHIPDYLADVFHYKDFIQKHLAGVEKIYKSKTPSLRL